MVWGSVSTHGTNSIQIIKGKMNGVMDWKILTMKMRHG